MTYGTAPRPMELHPGSQNQAHRTLPAELNLYNWTDGTGPVELDYGWSGRAGLIAPVW